MSDKESSDRRSFIKLCAGAAATAASYPETLIGSVGSGEFFNRTLLLDNTGHPLRASRLIQNQIGEFTTKNRVEKWGWLLHFLSDGLPRTTHPPVQFKCAGVLFDPQI